MIVRYRLIQFREAPLRGEGRNVAVVAWGGGRADLRALGLKPSGTIDLSCFERLLPEAFRSSSWVYAEWIARWTDILRRYERTPEALAAELDRMDEVSGGYLVAVEEGEFEFGSVPRPRGIEALVDPSLAAVRDAAGVLYGRLVAGGTVGGVPIPFLEAIDAALMISEIGAIGDLRRDETIAVDRDEQEEAILFFPYLLEEPVKAGFKSVCFTGSWESTVMAVNDAVLTFDQAAAAGLFERARCIALVDTAGSDHAPLTARLARSGQLVDVTAPDAPSRLRQLVLGKR